jgi:hypothetical protein
MPNRALIAIHIPMTAASTSLKHGVDLLNIGFVIYNPAFNFDPRVRLEGHGSRSNHQLRSDSISSEKASQSRRSLKAKRLFPIKNTSDVNSRADSFYVVWSAHRF